MPKRPGFPRFTFAPYPLALMLSAFPGRVEAVQFPDTTELKKEWKVGSRKDGKPILFRQEGADHPTIGLEWAGNTLMAVRHERDLEWESDEFTNLAQEFGAGGTWHETAVPRDSHLHKIHPGLEQQWVLKGYGPVKGWAGTGLYHGRYFVVFRETAPGTAVTARFAAPPTPPLALNGNIGKILDTAEGWVKVKCEGEGFLSGLKEKGRKRARPVCYSPEDDSHFLVRIDRESPLSLQVRLTGQEPLQEIRAVMDNLPDGSYHEYSRDLSLIMLGESQMFLIKVAQRVPWMFNWPSWNFQEFKAGKIPAKKYLALLGPEKQVGEFLPAFGYAAKNLKLDINLFYKGTVHLKAEELP